MTNLDVLAGSNSPLAGAGQATFHTQNTGAHSSVERLPPPQNRVHRGRRRCAFPCRRRCLLFHDTLAYNNSPPLLRSHRDPSMLAFFALAVDIGQKPFADSLNEELTNKISRIPGCGVSPPAPSFYFKGKLWAAFAWDPTHPRCRLGTRCEREQVRHAGCGSMGD